MSGAVLSLPLQEPNMVVGNIPTMLLSFKAQLFTRRVQDVLTSKAPSIENIAVVDGWLCYCTWLIITRLAMSQSYSWTLSHDSVPVI